MNISHRLWLGLLLLLLLPAPAVAQSNSIFTYRGIPWGASPEQTRGRMLELGYTAAPTFSVGFMATIDFTDPAQQGTRISAMFVNDRLGQVIHRIEVDSESAKQLFPAVAGDFERAYGPAHSSSEGNADPVAAYIKGQWRGWWNRQTEVEVSLKGSGSSSVITVEYMGPDMFTLPRHANRDPERNFAPLPERWTLLYVDVGQRVAAERNWTRLSSNQYRSWVRWDYVESQSGTRPLGSGAYTYDSSTMRVEFDCSNRRIRVQEAT